MLSQAIVFNPTVAAEGSKILGAITNTLSISASVLFSLSAKSGGPCPHTSNSSATDLEFLSLYTCKQNLANFVHPLLSMHNKRPNQICIPQNDKR